MSSSRPRRWLVRLAAWGFLLALVAVGGCGGSIAAPTGAGPTPVGISGGVGGDNVDSLKSLAVVDVGRQPLEAPAPGDGEAGPSVAKPKKPLVGEEDMSEHPFPRRVKAPSLEGGKEWLNSAGPLDIKDLRGKWVLLDFWTYCCINCMHILPELKKLERAHPHDLVVIGVHSAKFDTEKGTKNIREAI